MNGGETGMQYEIGDSEFRLFRDMIYREAGIRLSDLKKSLVQARLSRRLRSLNLETFRDYYDFLLGNYDQEKFNFINAITTNKTDFFREEKHFAFLRNVVFPTFEAENRDSITLWSAGCSTGEEPYSLAITFLDYFRNGRMPDVKILATDIDTQVLETARRGIYDKEKVAAIEPRIMKEYFRRGIRENEGLFSVKDCVREIVRLRRLNLLDGDYPMKKKFDIIFCRNVIIYFDKETQIELFRKFARYLKDDGYLFIGHSENILSFSDEFSLIGNTIYRKNVRMT